MAQAGYRIEVKKPTDDEITTRDKGARVMSVIFFSALIIALPTLLIGFWGAMFDHRTIGVLLGFSIGGIALGYFAPRRMFVYNPEWCAYVTQDVLSSEMVSYGPGLHLSHWWEQRNAEGNYSLAINRQPFSVDVVTATAKVTISGEYEHAIDLPLIEQAIGVSPAVVEHGITAFVENSLTDKYDKEPAETVKNKIGEMGKHLSDELMSGTGALADIRKQFGYKTVSIVVSKITLPKAAQETRDAIDEAEALFEVVAKLHGMTTDELKTALKPGGTITPTEYQKMLTRAMAVSDNKTTIDVKVIEGLEGSPAGAVAATLDALSKGGKK